MSKDYGILELLQKFDKMATQVDKLINHHGLKEEEKPAEEKPDTDYIKVEIVRGNTQSDTIEGESYNFFLWPIEAPDFHKIAKITNSHSTKTISLELKNLFIETYDDQEKFKVIELINENGDKVQTLSTNENNKYTLNVPPGVHHLRIYSDKAL